MDGVQLIVGMLSVRGLELLHSLGALDGDAK
jgi:hypothetical protein